MTSSVWAAPRVREWIWLWGPVVALMALIFLVSGMSSPPAPTNVGDKTLHFAAYGTLGVLAVRATAGGTLPGVSFQAALAAWAITTGYGVTDEFHQRFVPGRTPDVADVRADALGAMATIVPVWAFGIITRSRRSSGASPRRR